MRAGFLMAKAEAAPSPLHNGQADKSPKSVAPAGGAGRTGTGGGAASASSSPRFLKPAASSSRTRRLSGGYSPHASLSSPLVLRPLFMPGGGGGGGYGSGGTTGAVSPKQFKALVRTSSLPARVRQRREANNYDVGGSGSGSGSPRPSFRPLFRTGSNPFLQKPLSLASMATSSAESLPLVGNSASRTSMASSNGGAMTPLSPSSLPEEGDNGTIKHHPLEGQHAVEPHLTLLDLIAVGVGGTLGTGVFVLCSLITSTYAGPSSVLCWVLSAVAALLSGFCFAELAGQIPCAGSSYAYAYASMGELPAVVAAACLSLEYLVSASAVARSWGDKVVGFVGDFLGDDGGSSLFLSPASQWAMRLLRPGWNFNPMAFIISVCTAGLLLGGVKESKAVTNYFTAFKIAFVAFMILTGFGLMNFENLTPFVPPKFGAAGILRGATSSFFGYLGYDEVCCLTAEAIDPQRNMPRAIMWTIGILTTCYVAATVAMSGMLPYDEIDAVGGFPTTFRARDVEWAASMAAVGEVVTLPLVVLVAFMAQPRLQYALAQDGLMPSWLGEVDGTGNMRNGTLFAGTIMTVIASFVPFEYLDDMISAGVLVAFSMTNSSLILLRHESPDNCDGDPSFLLEKLLVAFNGFAFVSGLLLTHLCTSSVGKSITLLFVLLMVTTCGLIKRWCPPAEYFGGKTRRTTTQHVTIGVVSVEKEEFRAPLLPFFPCLGIFVNWYLVSQLSFSGLVLLIVFLACAVGFYFAFGYHYSVGNNGGWEAYGFYVDDGYMDEVASETEQAGSEDTDSDPGLFIE